MDAVYQPFYLRNECLTRTFMLSNFKKYESSSIRNRCEFGLNIQRTYKLQEDPDSENGVLEKLRGFGQKSLLPGVRTLAIEGNSKDVSNIKVIKEHNQNECKETKKLDSDRHRLRKGVQGLGYDRASILARDEERRISMSLKEETVKQVKGFNDFKKLSDDVRHSNTELRRPWPSIEILHLSCESLHWREIAMSTIIFGALFASIKLIDFKGKPQVYSIRGRILKSQWYGNPSTLPWERKCFRNPGVRLDYKDPPLMSVNKSQKSMWRTGINCGSIDDELTSARSPHHPIRQSLYERNGIHERAMRHTNHKALESSNRKKLYDSEANGSYKNYVHSGSTNRMFGMGKESTNNASEAAIENTNVAKEIGKVRHGKWSSYGGRALMQDDCNESKALKMRGVNKEAHQQMRIGKEKLDLERCISELYQTVQAVEHHRRTVMIALNEERQRSIILEGEILKQKQAAAALSKEIQNLKDSHNALLSSLRKKYSSPVAVRAAADLIYQDFEGKAVAESQ